MKARIVLIDVENAQEMEVEPVSETQVRCDIGRGPEIATKLASINPSRGYADDLYIISLLGDVSETIEQRFGGDRAAMLNDLFN